jgi:hypothetical protein
MFLTGDTNPYTYLDLILPGGGRIHYTRTSSGTGYQDAVYTHTTTNTEYAGSIITFNSSAWQLRLKNGTVIRFSDSEQAVAPAQAAVKSISDRYGNTLTLTRDPGTGNLIRITSPNARWISFTYDNANRIAQASDKADAR